MQRDRRKTSVAQSIAAVLGANHGMTGIWRAAGTSCRSVSGIWQSWPTPPFTMPMMPNGRWRRCPSFLPRSASSSALKKQKQFDILRELMRREDVAEVVNACDAGREGELIFRTVYCLAGCPPILRLWISSMEDDAIRSGFQQLKSGRDYDGLHQSALCRAKADWLVGINATRYFSPDVWPHIEHWARHVAHAGAAGTA